MFKYSFIDPIHRAACKIQNVLILLLVTPTALALFHSSHFQNTGTILSQKYPHFFHYSNYWQHIQI